MKQKEEVGFLCYLDGDFPLLQEDDLEPWCYYIIFHTNREKGGSVFIEEAYIFLTSVMRGYHIDYERSRAAYLRYLMELSLSEFLKGNTLKHFDFISITFAE